MATTMSATAKFSNRRFIGVLMDLFKSITRITIVLPTRSIRTMTEKATTRPTSSIGERCKSGGFNAQLFITAPNIFHLGVEETVSVIIYSSDRPVNVTVIVQDFPDKKIKLAAASGVFTNEVPGFLKLKLDPKDFPVDVTDEDDLATHRYVSLVAKSNDSDVTTNKEAKVLVSFLDGIVLLQTDKPIYTPQQSSSLEYARGFITQIFGLSEFALTGQWTVVALHGHEHKKPGTIEAQNSAVYNHLRSSGHSFGLSGVTILDKEEDWVRRGIKEAVWERLQNGKASFNITVDDIKTTPGLPWFPDGRRLQIEADVVEKTSGKKESAIDNGIYFVKSPFRIDHKATAEFFKPALPFLVKVDLKYPDKTPARGVPTSISVTGTTHSGSEIDIGKVASKRDNVNFEDATDNQGRANFVIDVPGNVRKMNIRVGTEKDDFDHNTFVEFDVQAYESPSRTFLYVRAIREKQYFNCDVFVNKKASKITFMVIARGRMLRQWVKVQRVGVISSFRFKILPEMSPSSRLVAFFIGENGEVVSDSVLLEIDDGLPNKVEFNDESPGKQKNPGVPYKIQLSATPGTRVALLAVDKSVYILRNREKLNKKRVLNSMESLDLGCGVGSGSDSQDVFYKSGIVVITNTNIASRGRSDFSCPQSKTKRKRRSTADPRKTEVKVRARSFKQSDDEFEDEEISQGQIRKYFPETWIFMDDVVGPNGKFNLYTNLPDTITTWVVQAVGISNQTGLGVARPLNIQAFKNFFVSLRLPYSVQRGEQISIIATVFNYGKFELKVKVKLEESKEFCTNAPTGQKSAVLNLDIKENDAGSVTFPIVPIKLGKVFIKVIATAEILEDGLFGVGVIGPTAFDTVVRSILVVPEGVERRVTHSFLLDPQGVLRDEAPDKVNTSPPSTGMKHDRVVNNGMQVDNVFLKVPSRAIPGSLRAVLSLTGNLIGPVVTTLITGGLENLLHMPMGCGEQTMIFLAPNVYVMQYLLRTRQVTAEIESKAYRMIQSGYQRALNYRRKDRSFSAFGEHRPGSTWLTAFVVRVLCAAQKFDGVEIDHALVCDSVSWLLENQRQDGAFPEVKDIIHKSMMGGTHGDVAMTAFVSVALLECGCHGQNKSHRIQNAVAFMESELDSISKVNTLALTTYALALAGSRKSSKANAKLLRMQTYNKDKSTRFWDAGNQALNVETTAYALLAQMAVGRLKLAGPIVAWLTTQRDPQGGFVSTQITHLLRGEMFIDSLGSGVGQLQIEVRHNVPSPKNETCSFSLKIEVREEFRKDNDKGVPIAGRSRQRRDYDARDRKARKCKGKKRKKACKKRKKNKKHHKKPKTEAKPPDALHLRICVKYLKAGKSGMTIMDIGIFSGFTPDKDSLVEISSIDEFCATFTVNRVFDVGTVQPVPVKVYDYYKPDESCTELYSPSTRSALLGGICEEGYCRCSQDKYAEQMVGEDLDQEGTVPLQRLRYVTVPRHETFLPSDQLGEIVRVNCILTKLHGWFSVPLE
ncbi:Complement C3 [Stylophora pistillata]|uniref:Complement C3 n=1 Tax=Stylophora pistillata TaxID=50429 RepID=A0A2B4SP95_STYPI|nr:Complement C3 [Stylophora pistillata]